VQLTSLAINIKKLILSKTFYSLPTRRIYVKRTDEILSKPKVKQNKKTKEEEKRMRSIQTRQQAVQHR